jgi:hypothetical protein
MAMAPTPWSKKGEGMGSSGHTHQQGEQALASIDHHGGGIGPLAMQPVHKPDTLMLPTTLTHLVALTSRLGMNLSGAAWTLEAGVDSQAPRDTITNQQMQPWISPHRRNITQSMALARQLRWFHRDISRERYQVERTFGWQDVYRTLVVSYDWLPAIRQGCRLLAYVMINYRVPFSSSYGLLTMSSRLKTR